MYGFSSFAGILDKIDHISWESAGGRVSFSLGAQHDLTIGSGNVVNGFSNTDPYRLFQPLGLSASFSTNELGLQVFWADISQFSLGGVRVAYSPSTYHFGAGYFFDADQFSPISPKENNRFKILPDTASDTIAAASLNAHIYEFDFSWDAVVSEDLQASIHVDFAQKLKSGSTDGFVFNVPWVVVSWNSLRIGAGLVAESGRLIDGQFNSVYMANRGRLFGASGIDTLVTQNTILSEKRLCQGAKLSFAINPYKGTAVEFSLRQNLHEDRTFSIDTMKLAPGTDLSLSLCVNDSLLKPIRFGEVFLRQEHSGLYPPHSALFSSWEFIAGASVITHPLYFGISVDAQLSYQFLDMNFDNKLNQGDGLLCLSIGFSRGFN
jgi:hypothetical protein